MDYLKDATCLPELLLTAPAYTCCAPLLLSEVRGVSTREACQSVRPPRACIERGKIIAASASKDRSTLAEEKGLMGEARCVIARKRSARLGL